MRLYLTLFLILSAASLLANACRCRFSQWSNWSNWSGCLPCRRHPLPQMNRCRNCINRYQGSSIKDDHTRTEGEGIGQKWSMVREVFCAM